MLYGFAEAKFLQGKNERSLEQTKISGTVTTVKTLRTQSIIMVKGTKI